MLSVNLLNVLLAASPSMLIVMLLATMLIAVLRNSKQEKESTQARIAVATPNDDIVTESNPLMAAISSKMDKEHLFLQRGLKLDDMAAACHTNRTYISNCINQYTGMNFANYVNSYRVNYSKELLKAKTSGVTISQIGQMSGFSDEVSFIRNFKKNVGMTPSEWVATLN